jgi:hypothetical protein
MMSKQLKLSASLSALAMLGLALASSPVAADELSQGTSRLHAAASACTSALTDDLLPALQPTLQ